MNNNMNCILKHFETSFSSHDKIYWPEPYIVQVRVSYWKCEGEFLEIQKSFCFLLAHWNLHQVALRVVNPNHEESRISKINTKEDN